MAVGAGFEATLTNCAKRLKLTTVDYVLEVLAG